MKIIYAIILITIIILVWIAIMTFIKINRANKFLTYQNEMMKKMIERQNVKIHVLINNPNSREAKDIRLIYKLKNHPDKD